MANSEASVFVSIGYENFRAAKAMMRALSIARGMRADQPWNDDVRRLCKLLRYASDNLAALEIPREPVDSDIQAVIDGVPSDAFDKPGPDERPLPEGDL